MTDGRILDRLWLGTGSRARLARASVVPLELVYGAATSLRSALYDKGVLRVAESRIPAVSVGNLTVGGTGKTPVAAWIAGMLQSRGASPAIVLRGYGDDEPLVHGILNRDVPVVTSADRVEGMARARAMGCDVVVLDDAFQHRRAPRLADIVLISADRWTGSRPRLLPAGPWRERLSAVRRATLVIVTRKAAGQEDVDSVEAAVARIAPAVPTAAVHLAPDGLRRVGRNDGAPLAVLRGETVLAVSAVGDPDAFHAQLVMTGANIVTAVYRDHHRFTASDVAVLSAAAAGVARVVCTLKDAVKLGPLWPPTEPLWYVSQRVSIERGREAVERILNAALAARSV